MGIKQISFTIYPNIYAHDSQSGGKVFVHMLFLSIYGDTNISIGASINCKE